MAAALPGELATTMSLERRVRRIIESQLDRFRPHRRFLAALVQTAFDPANPLSPFGEDTKPIREQAIEWFRQAIEGSSESVPKDVAPLLPTLFWLYQMGVIAFWFDRSPGQKRTQALLDGTLELLVKLLRLSGCRSCRPSARASSGPAGHRDRRGVIAWVYRYELVPRARLNARARAGARQGALLRVGADCAGSDFAGGGFARHPSVARARRRPARRTTGAPRPR